jgi:transposase
LRELCLTQAEDARPSAVRRDRPVHTKLLMTMTLIQVPSRKDAWLSTRGCLAKEGRNRMEEQEERGHEHAQAAKAHLVMLMQMGYLWHKAAASAGLQIGRSTAYRLLKAVRTQGETAFQDGREGHPTKLQAAVLQWLLTTCRAAPQMPSREMQVALQEQFGIHVSIGHLNRVGIVNLRNSIDEFSPRMPLFVLRRVRKH